jgi:hypothetical protein
MVRGNTRILWIFGAAFLAVISACRPPNQVNPQLSAEMPPKFLWAWERPEDLRFLDPKEYGVAFLAQTIFLEQNTVTPKPRRQPLEIAPDAYLIAVTRIETAKDNAKRPSFDDETIGRTVRLIKMTLELPDVRAIQIDFDAIVSERDSYRKMMFALRKELDKDAGKSVRTPLTMTSLASWCTGDAWFNDFPVDEAVPMAFQMGADSEKIKTYLKNGNDWTEPLCRGSYGFSVEEQIKLELKPNRRVYYFKNSAWKSSDIDRLR